VRHVLGVELLGDGVAALFQAGPILRGSGGQEAREIGELDDGEQSAWTEQVADLAQCAFGVGQVMHRGGRPDEVGRAEVGPFRGVEIGLHDAYPVDQVCGVCLGSKPFEVLDGGVDAGDVSLRKLAEEGERARAGPRSEIHDLHRRGLDRQPGREGGDVLAQNLRVEVEHPGQVVVLRVIGVWVLVARFCGRGAVVLMTGVHEIDPRNRSPYWQVDLQKLQDTVKAMITDTAGVDLSQVVRQRIRGLRQARGWNLDALAARCNMSPSTLSRIETGQRSIGLEQLVPLARALGTTIDHLVESEQDEDVLIHPVSHQEPGLTTWLLSRESPQPGGSMVAKMRITRRRRHGPGYLAVHPGKEWFTVLSGTALLHLGDRKITVETGQAAEFSTMTPHSIGTVGEPVEILTIFDADGERAHHQSVNADLSH